MLRFWTTALPSLLLLCSLDPTSASSSTTPGGGDEYVLAVAFSEGQGGPQTAPKAPKSSKRGKGKGKGTSSKGRMSKGKGKGGKSKGKSASTITTADPFRSSKGGTAKSKAPTTTTMTTTTAAAGGGGAGGSEATRTSGGDRDATGARTTPSTAAAAASATTKTTAAPTADSAAAATATSAATTTKSATGGSDPTATASFSSSTTAAVTATIADAGNAASGATSTTTVAASKRTTSAVVATTATASATIDPGATAMTTTHSTTGGASVPMTTAAKTATTTSQSGAGTGNKEGVTDPPSATPSATPSEEPSTAPSKTPSEPPSSAPTETRTPSSRPTIAPSLIPSTPPSSAPSSAPTVTSSPTATNLPTTSPTASSMPSSAPVIETFLTTTVTYEDGTMGKEARCLSTSTPSLPTDAPDPNKNLELSYDYAILTLPDTNLEEALESVEDAMLEMVARKLLDCDDEGDAVGDGAFRRLRVTVTYGDDNGSDVNRDTPAAGATGRAEANAGSNATDDDDHNPVAANTFPPDVERTDLECLPSENDDPAVDCAVVDGGFTLIFPADIALDIDALRQEYLSFVKHLMAPGGELEGSIHPNVIGFVFRGYSGVNPGDDGADVVDRDREDDEDPGGANVAAVTDTQILEGDDDGISGFGAAMMAGSVMVTIAVLAAAMRRRRRQSRCCRPTVERELYIDEEEDGDVKEHDNDNQSLYRDSSFCPSERNEHFHRYVEEERHLGGSRMVPVVEENEDSSEATTNDEHSIYDPLNDAMASVMRNIEYYDDITISTNEVTAAAAAYPDNEVALAGTTNVHQCNSVTCDRCRRRNAGGLEGGNNGLNKVRFLPMTQAEEEEGMGVLAGRGRLEERRGGEGGGKRRGQILGDRVPRSSRTSMARVQGRSPTPRGQSPSWNLTR